MLVASEQYSLLYMHTILYMQYIHFQVLKVQTSDISVYILYIDICTCIYRDSYNSPGTVSKMSRELSG